MPRVNILKQIKVGDGWRLVSIPQDAHGRNDYRSLPDGRYFIEWWEHGKRRRQAAGGTTAEALEAARRRKHVLEGRALGVEAQEEADEEGSRTPLHLAAKRYLEIVETLKKPNTLRKYRAVLNRFLEYFGDRTTAKSITPDDLNRFMVHLKKIHHLENNSVIHNLIIVAQFLKKHGRPGLTRNIELPEPSTTLPKDYTDKELAAFFGACSPTEFALFLTFLLTGFREQEVVHLFWGDVNIALKTVRVTSKSQLSFSPKRWEEREVPVPQKLIDVLEGMPRDQKVPFVFPSPRGNRELHMLDRCKGVASRAKLNPARFDLRKFRSTFATRMLRAGFDVRTVQHWMGHKSLETTMRYLAPAVEVREKLEKIQIAGLLESDVE